MMGKCSRLSLVAVVGSLMYVSTVSAETFTVSTEEELLGAIAASQGNQEGDTIDLEGATITLTSEMVISLKNDDQLIIKNGTLTSELLATHRLITVKDTRISPATPANITFSDMEFTDAYYEYDPVLADDLDLADVPASERGGAALLLLDVDATISDSRFEDNIALGDVDGGAIRISEGNLVITRSEFSGNDAVGAGSLESYDADGGAIAAFDVTSLQIINSTFSENSASNGGAIYTIRSTQTDVISQSSFSFNDAFKLGGAIWTRSAFNLNTSTLYLNAAVTAGGAIYFQDRTSSSESPTITNNTFVDNFGGNVGAQLHFYGQNVRPNVFSNIFLGGPDIGKANCSVSGTLNGASIFLSHLHNISDDNSCGDDTGTTVIDSAADLLATVAPIDNGSEQGVKGTLSFALLADSIAVDAGGELGGVACTTAQDQLGFDRINACDVGSFELQSVQLDSDRDGYPDDADNCPAISNPDQTNTDNVNDGGDACDDDDDNDGQSDLDEMICLSDPLDAANTAPDDDNDGEPNCVDLFTDSDKDGIDDDSDNCPLIGNSLQENYDEDEAGDACDFDDDNDGQSDVNESACGSDPEDATSTSPDDDGDAVPNCADEDFVEVSYRSDLTEVAVVLDDVKANVSGQTSTDLSRGIIRLRYALNEKFWPDNNTVSGTVMFNIMGRALSDIELVLNANPDDSELQEVLGTLSGVILDKLRELAVNKLEDAYAADGHAGRIRRAEAELLTADAKRETGSLQASALDYRDTWRIANYAF